MKQVAAWSSLLLLMLAFTACSEEPPAVDWELAIDGDVNQPVTYTFEDLVQLKRANLLDVPTRNPEKPDETTSWEGVTLFLLMQEPGGVEYTVNSWVMVTLANGAKRRLSMLWVGRWFRWTGQGRGTRRPPLYTLLGDVYVFMIYYSYEKNNDLA